MGWREKAKWVQYTLLPATSLGDNIVFDKIIRKPVKIVKVYDKYGNVVNATTSVVVEGASSLADDIFNEAQNLGAEVIEDIKDVSLEVASAALEVIEGAGLAVLSAGELMFDYTYSKVSPHRVEAVTAMTALTVYLTTAIIVFKKIRGVN